MPLREEMERQGEWLFRWRGVLPVCLVAVLAVAIWDAEPIEPAGEHWVDSWLHVVALAVCILGLTIRVLTIGTVPKRTSGRGTRHQKAESLNTTGLYSIVRHPLYLGNFFYFLGFAVITGVPWMSLVYALMFWIYYERIYLVEEQFLRGKFGEEFVEWASRTPAFIPRFRKFKSSSQSFSWRMVLRRETSPWLGVAVGLFAIESLLDYRQRGTVDFDPIWIVLLTVTGVTYLGVKVAKKATPWLDLRSSAQNAEASA